MCRSISRKRLSLRLAQCCTRYTRPMARRSCSPTAARRRMADQPDKANVIVRPPIALLLAFLAGLLADWLYPLKLLPALLNSRHDTFAPIDSYGFPVWADWSVPHVLLGSFIFVAGFALMVWAITTIRAAGTHVQTTQPTTAIVAEGPYRFSRNPIY